MISLLRFNLIKIGTRVRVSILYFFGNNLCVGLLVGELLGLMGAWWWWHCRSAAAALMMGDDFHKLNRVRMARNDFSVMGMRVDSNPGSRQIYLTFPADSTFKEEDVSEYFR